MDGDGRVFGVRSRIGGEVRARARCSFPDVHTLSRRICYTDEARICTRTFEIANRLNIQFTLSAAAAAAVADANGGNGGVGTAHSQQQRQDARPTHY